MSSSNIGLVLKVSGPHSEALLRWGSPSRCYLYEEEGKDLGKVDGIFFPSSIFDHNGVVQSREDTTTTELHSDVDVGETDFPKTAQSGAGRAKLCYLRLCES